MSDKHLRDIILIVALNVLIELALVVAYASAMQTVQQQTESLVEGYDMCMQDANRTTPCELEYDGDGSTTYPNDWHWYWR